MRTAVGVAIACFSIVSLSSAENSIAAIRKHTSIPAQDLGSALQALATQREMHLMLVSGDVKDLRTSAISGDLTAEEALRIMLRGTGLTYRLIDEKTISILPAPGAGAVGTPPAAPASRRLSPEARPENATTGFWSRLRLARADEIRDQETAAQTIDEPSQLQKRVELEEVAVTGSRIKGAEVSSPVVRVSAEEMRRSGHNSLGEALRALPQNFSGGQNPGVAAGAGTTGGASNQNVTGASSLNLRGLGQDATLTLLNGARLPYDGFFQATDAASIPVAAIERVEVLLDGASAIYGSDAVGGVANIILKRDYQGAELSARYGRATDGGYEQEQYTAVAGGRWQSGGFIVTGDYSGNSSILAKDRSYLSYMPGTSELYPRIGQKSSLLSIHQSIGSVVDVALDAFYTRRNTRTYVQSNATRFSNTDVDSDVWGIVPALRFELPREWSVSLHGAVGRNEAQYVQEFFNAVGNSQTRFAGGFFNKAEAAGLEAEGPFLALPGGEARLSAGGGYRRNALRRVSGSGVPPVDGADRSHSLYGEVNLPLLSDAQEIPFVRRLSVNGAFRYEEYDSFGETTTPKFGIVWGIISGLDFRASWGKSFKVPTLYQQFSGSELWLDHPSFITGAPDGTAIMAQFGGNPDLGPERAETVTAGFTFSPQSVPGLVLELGWFDIDYTDRVVVPVTPYSQALVNPAFAAFVIINPSVEQQNAAFAEMGYPVGTFTGNIAGPGFEPAPYDPATVHVIIDTRNTNAAAQHANGFDLSARYSGASLLGGQLSITGNAGWMDSTRRLSQASPEAATAGVVYFPAKFKSRLGAAWLRGGLTVASHVNHIGGVRNNLVAPFARTGSMTTVDLVTDYQLEAGSLSGMGFNVAITNVLNKRPPFMQPLQTYQVNYDSTNYSAIGRAISVTLAKRF